MKIIIVGPAHPYRGGIAAFTDRLATEFVAEDVDVEVYTFTLQYPSFLFPGKTQYSDAPAPENIKIFRKIKYCKNVGAIIDCSLFKENTKKEWRKIWT